MTYEEAVDYIDSVPKFTTKNRPEHTVEMMERLGRPERGMNVIHVAGTNGKGSVCAFLASMLTAGGHRTGLFTSPHLIRINERFQIDGQMVSDAEFLSAYTHVWQTVEKMIRDGYPHPAYFELLYAVGMVIFQRREVEYLVLETGLGGRLDATNTVERPIACVLTSISLDHTEILGDTIEQIAWEKAGIIKKEIPVIFDGKDPKAAQVIRSRAAELHAPATELRTEMYRILDKTDKSIDFALDVGYYEHSTFTVPFPAPYQVQNASLALLAMETVDAGHQIPLEVRRSALAGARWQGRMENVLPGVLLDGAHNEDGIREFAKILCGISKNRRIVLLFSAVVEKNYERMIRTICETGRLSEVVVTQIDGSRVVPAQELADVFAHCTDVPVSAVPDVGQAFSVALEKKKDGLLFCAGSLYLVGEIKGIIEENSK